MINSLLLYRLSYRGIGAEFCYAQIIQEGILNRTITLRIVTFLFSFLAWHKFYQAYQVILFWSTFYPKMEQYLPVLQKLLLLFLSYVMIIYYLYIKVNTTFGIFGAPTQNRTAN